MVKKINIGIAERTAKSNWNDKFLDSLEKKLKEGHNISYSIVNLDRSDWITQIKPFDIIIWKSPWMGRLSFHYKEKMFFIKNYLGKEIIPNFESIWHFDSKIAQHFLFEYYHMHTPKTFITFDYVEALRYIDTCVFPQILKLSAGSASNNVKMLKNKRQAIKEIKKHFFKTIFWKKIKKLSDHQMFGSIYLQDFIPNNTSDLRITTIGDKYAFGFWRKNRENDFRASGSGRIDYEREIPEEPLNYCLNLSKQFNFDSMAYDIIFDKDNYLITEICYGYNQDAIFNANGFYEKIEDNKLIFKKGHYWPQELWIEWLFEKYKIIIFDTINSSKNR
jgi:glutathione synthase/RimK-type ligase-like ATP-grasp enzyme